MPTRPVAKHNKLLCAYKNRGTLYCSWVQLYGSTPAQNCKASSAPPNVHQHYLLHRNHLRMCTWETVKDPKGNLLIQILEPCHSPKCLLFNHYGKRNSTGGIVLKKSEVEELITKQSDDWGSTVSSSSTATAGKGKKEDAKKQEKKR